MISALSHIKDGNVRTRFQPVFSIKTRTIVGVEALSYAQINEEIISPLVLFQSAREQGCLLELDRECRRSAFKNFAEKRPEELLLFINFDSSLIDTGAAGSGYILDQCRTYGIEPEMVVIEIVESVVHNEEALLRFVDTYRSHGFIIAIDDVGEGYSNLNRIALLKPDIIKGDKSLASGIDHNFTKQKIVASLAQLSRNIGSLFLLEGVETEEEAVTSFGLGIDLVQGYFFARPGNLGAEKLSDSVHLMQKTSLKAREISIKKEADYSKYVEECFAALDTVAACLSEHIISQFDECLSGFTDCLGGCECLYVINHLGIQVSDTILAVSFPKKVRFASIFHPARKGEDHSLKEYFYLTSLLQKKYSTDFYISLASGKQCFTLTLPFFNENEKNLFYLCADLSGNIAAQ